MSPADPLGVRTACAAVVASARDVRLGPLDRLLAEAGDRPVPRWDGSRHYAGPAERTLRYLLVLDTVNFSFWGGSAGGYWQLAERLRDAFATGEELSDAEGLTGVTAGRLRELLGDLPMLEERAQALRELGGHARRAPALVRRRGHVRRPVRAAPEAGADRAGRPARRRGRRVPRPGGADVLPRLQAAPGPAPLRRLRVLAGAGPAHRRLGGAPARRAGGGGDPGGHRGRGRAPARRAGRAGPAAALDRGGLDPVGSLPGPLPRAAVPSDSHGLLLSAGSPVTFGERVVR
ncbi:MAG: hypothetical protein E6J41_16820 [Chloroflexi bacterium]|nr:MAG: hypothetical protein E6J41_16820 [Chloroflexota bacterium]